MPTRELIIERLKHFGYEVKAIDDIVLTFCISKVKQTIKNECNTITVPEGLIYVAIDMACGEFLYCKKQSGQLEGFDFEDALKSVKAGDTDVTFVDGVSAEQQFDMLIKYLIDGRRAELICYRRIKW